MKVLKIELFYWFQEILDLLGTSYEEIGEVVDSFVESAVELKSGDKEAIRGMMEATEELLTYVPHLPSGTYEFQGRHGVAMSLNIRRPKRDEMNLRKQLWRRLGGMDQEV